jgi:uncharacterized protein (TIGR02118 family)
VPRLIVLYPTPSDAQDFEKMYHEEHEPLVRAQLGAARKLTGAQIEPMGDQATPYHWMAEFHFDTMEELKQAIASDGGLRTGAHARQISTGGPPLMFVVTDAMEPVNQPSA